MPTKTLSISISGKVQVLCAHGRDKRALTDLAFDPAKEKPHLCPCCENLYTKVDDIPGYCSACQGPSVTARSKFSG